MHLSSFNLSVQEQLDILCLIKMFLNQFADSIVACQVCHMPMIDFSRGCVSCCFCLGLPEVYACGASASHNTIHLTCCTSTQNSSFEILISFTQFFVTNLHVFMSFFCLASGKSSLTHVTFCHNISVHDSVIQIKKREEIGWTLSILIWTFFSALSSDV